MLTLVLIMLSALAATLPMIGFLAFVWWMDRYDREPVWMVLLTFGWGALGATLLSLMGNTSAHVLLSWILGPELANTITPVIVAPLVEEPTKAAILLVVMLSRQFDNTTDGFVYGAAAGLGFGMTENFLYFTTVASYAGFDPIGGLLSWLSTVCIRTFYSALMHAMTASGVGAALGAVRDRSRWLLPPALLFGVSIAMGAHALWNGLLTLDSQLERGGQLVTLDFILFPAELILALIIFQVSLKVEQHGLRAELDQEAADGTLPLAHVPLLTSWSARTWRRWAPEGVDQEGYARTAVRLALRRTQCRSAKGERATQLDRDIRRLRLEIKAILSGGTSPSG